MTRLLACSSLGLDRLTQGHGYYHDNTSCRGMTIDTDYAKVVEEDEKKQFMCQRYSHSFPERKTARKEQVSRV